MDLGIIRSRKFLILKNKIENIRNSLNEIKKFKNPLGKIITRWKRPNGLTIKKISIPIGVIGVIYESRPDVTPYVSALCIKSGNVAILRGGSEAYFSNKILLSESERLSDLLSMVDGLN